MQDHLFEYAVIRVMPRVEREEFINAGVILYCAKLKFLQVVFTLDENRICALCNDLDMEELRQHFDSFNRICAGGLNAGPIGKLDLASRFRWLTATRSTVLQSSKVHPGFCKNPEETLLRLHHQLVL